jgi:GTP-binding protein EngB required for normal cell division
MTPCVRRRGFTQLDEEVAELMTHFAVPFQVVLTKADQIVSTPGAVQAAASMAAAHASQSHIAFPNLNIISAQYGYGMPELMGSLAMAAGLRRVQGVEVREKHPGSRTM